MPDELDWRDIAELRGGLPEACDFCGQPYGPERYPVPEEAGEWACSECLARWDAADAERAEQQPQAERLPDHA